MENHKMDKDVFLSVFNDETTVKTRNEVMRLIDKRFCYIVEYLFKLNDVEPDWYDYDNGYDDNGHFDTVAYGEVTDFTGEWNSPNEIESDELNAQSFPNRWYYEDFETELSLELARMHKEHSDKLEKQRLKREKQKERKELAIKSIKEKLTPEELSHIKFK